MNFKDSILSSSTFYGQSYQPVTLLRASAHASKIQKVRLRRFRSLDTAIGGSSKDVLYLTLCVLSDLVEPHVIPLKVRLAVALKKETK